MKANVSPSRLISNAKSTLNKLSNNIETNCDYFDLSENNNFHINDEKHVHALSISQSREKKFFIFQSKENKEQKTSNRLTQLYKDKMRICSPKGFLKDAENCSIISNQSKKALRKSAIFDELNHFRSTRNTDLETIANKSNRDDFSKTKGSVQDIVKELQKARSRSKVSLENKLRAFVDLHIPQMPSFNLIDSQKYIKHYDSNFIEPKQDFSFKSQQTFTKSPVKNELKSSKHHEHFKSLDGFPSSRTNKVPVVHLIANSFGISEAEELCVVLKLNVFELNRAHKRVDELDVYKKVDERCEEPKIWKKLQRMYFRKRFSHNLYRNSADSINGKATLKSLKIGNLVAIDNKKNIKNI